MLFAFFTSCLVTVATGDVQCTNSYTEMSSVAGNAAVCEIQAVRLQSGAINSVLLAQPGNIAVSVRSGCGTLKQVKAQAESTHKSYQANGIHSLLFRF